MAGHSFFKKKDRTNMRKVGPFWYPTDFYEAADDHVMGPILREYCYATMQNDNYEYLMSIRFASKKDAFAIIRDFLNDDSILQLNVTNDMRYEAIDAINELFAPSERPSKRREKRKYARMLERDRRRNAGGYVAPVGQQVINDTHVTTGTLKEALNDITNQVNQMIQFAVMSDQIWRSEIFLGVHKRRVNRFLRHLSSKGSFNADRAAREESKDYMLDLYQEDMTIDNEYYQNKYVKKPKKRFGFG